LRLLELHHGVHVIYGICRTIVRKRKIVHHHAVVVGCGIVEGGCSIRFVSIQLDYVVIVLKANFLEKMILLRSSSSNRIVETAVLLPRYNVMVVVKGVR
jgi:hypothetical protein